MHKHVLSIVICLFICIASNYGQEIFSGETEDVLLDHLRDDYSPNSVLGLNRAKDTIYSRIDNVDGTVSTVYCDHSLDLPEGVDPSQWMFTGPNGGRGASAINLEHVYPRSKGAEDGSEANSDMHHLYPTRANVNSDRASFPFADINDNQTSKWYLNLDVLNNPPSASTRDLYSEFATGRFEPRESKKGDIARAVFYFYTIYEDRALASDPDFFESMRPTLCQWHVADDIDEAERRRSQNIAQSQGNENPFAIDCTLPLRSYCIDMDLTCNEIIAVHDLIEIQEIKTYVNANGNIQLDWSAAENGFSQFVLINSMGQLIDLNNKISTQEGNNSIAIESSALPNGIYFIKLLQQTTQGLAYWSGSIIISK